jgi:hypothetical protein
MKLAAQGCGELEEDGSIGRRENASSVFLACLVQQIRSGWMSIASAITESRESVSEGRTSFITNGKVASITPSQTNKLLAF